MNRIIVAILLLMLSFQTFAQKPINADTLKIKNAVNKALAKKDTVKKQHLLLKEIVGAKKYTPQHYPKVAFFRSLILPGWGQATNKQYWKMPLVYGAAAGGIYAIRWNNYHYLFYRSLLREFNSYIKTYEGNGHLIFPTTTTSKVSGVYYYTVSGTEYTKYGPFVSSQVEPKVNSLRHQRDYSAILFAVGWMLQAMEANVAAHLRSFDVNDNITINFKPSIEPTTFSSPAVGMGIHVGF